MPRKLALFIAFAMIMLMTSACGVLQKLGLIGDDADLRPVSSIVMSEEDAKLLSDKVALHIYFANPDNTKLSLQIRYIPVTEAKKSVNNLASAIVRELLSGPGPNTALKQVIPTGTRLLAPVSVDNSVAAVNLSNEFVNNHPGGKLAEQLTIYSIVNSLTEIKEISKVKFLVEGKARTEYKGSFQFDAPFPRAASMIERTPSAVSEQEVPTANDPDDGDSEELLE